MVVYSKNPHVVLNLGIEKLKLCQIIVEYHKLKQMVLQLQLVCHIWY